MSDLFGSTIAAPSTSIIGLTVILPRPCHACGSFKAVIGSSAGPHCARYVCGDCCLFLSWMRAETYAFVCDVVDNFGRPTEPITIRMTGLSSYAH
jgi:hypothetical protein